MDIRLRDIFDRKERRRQRLAALPFPEKVRILVKLQSLAAPIERAKGQKVRV